MAFKFVIISCLVALVRAGNIPAAVVADPAVVEVPAPVVAARLEEFDIPDYKFEYNVNDVITNDVKSHSEERKGNLVVGQYTVREENGDYRVVDYYANENGFNAVVSKALGQFVVEEPAVLPARVAAAPAPVFPARIAAAPAPVVAPVVTPAARFVPAPAPVFAPRYAFQPYAPFTAPLAYPGSTQVVTV